MGRRLAVGAGVVVALALGAATDAVASPRVQAVGESSVGYTDNAQLSARAGSTESARSRSAFLMLSPGAVLALLKPRYLQRLSYSYEYDLYFNNSASSSSSHRLDYRGFFELSRRISLVLGGNAIQSDRFTKVAFAAPGAGTVGALPTGTGSYLRAGADQALSFDVAEGWRAWQSSSALIDRPLFDTDAPQTVGVAARSGAERVLFSDAVGLEARGDYTVVRNSVRVDGSRAPVQRQLAAGGVALWRHDWGRYFTSNAQAGVLRVQRLNTDKGFWTPIATSSLAYATEKGDAQLAYAHTVTSNALLGQSLLVDEVRLLGNLPLTSEGELALAASCGYQRGRLLDENAELRTRVQVVLADVSFGWQATKWLAVGVRYQHIEQDSGADTPPLPVSFVQNNVLLGATLKFPPEQDMPRAYRAPRRVDRSDELREGFRPDSAGPRAPGGAVR